MAAVVQRNTTRWPGQSRMESLFLQLARCGGTLPAHGTAAVAVDVCRSSGVLGAVSARIVVGWAAGVEIQGRCCCEPCGALPLYCVSLPAVLLSSDECTGQGSDECTGQANLRLFAAAKGLLMQVPLPELAVAGAGVGGGRRPVCVMCQVCVLLVVFELGC